MCVCVYVCLSVCLCACVHVCVVYVYIYMCVCVYSPPHMHAELYGAHGNAEIYKYAIPDAGGTIRARVRVRVSVRVRVRVKGTYYCRRRGLSLRIVVWL